MVRRQACTDSEVTAALVALDEAPRRVSGRAWPDDLVSLDSPGLYSWWVDADGAADLARGLEAGIRSGRIYAGQTGATKWPSGKTGNATLRTRIGGNHLRGRIRASTFRLTLAAALRDSLDLAVVGPKRLDSVSERRLSDWIRSRLEVAIHAFPEPDALGHLEHCVLERLDPPLNLEGRPSTPVRAALSRRRAELASVGGLAAPKVLAVQQPDAQPTVAPAEHISSFIQAELRRRHVREVTAVEAARWLDAAAVLRDSDHRPGLPLRNLVRAGLIAGAEQRPARPNGRWFITLLD